MKDSNLLGAVLIAGAIVLFGLCQRYEVVDMGGHRLVKLDRLTGQAEPCMIMPDDESATPGWCGVWDYDQYDPTG